MDVGQDNGYKADLLTETADNYTVSEENAQLYDDEVEDDYGDEYYRESSQIDQSRSKRVSQTDGSYMSRSYMTKNSAHNVIKSKNSTISVGIEEHNDTVGDLESNEALAKLKLRIKK